MRIELDKISVDFKCPKCEATEIEVPVTEIIETGCPMCAKCEEEMEYACAHLEQMEGISR